MEKHSVSRLSYLFAHLYLLSSYSFSSDLLSSNLPLLSASALLSFSSLHIVGSLTSKLPSIIIYICTHASTINNVVNLVTHDDMLFFDIVQPTYLRYQTMGPKKGRGLAKVAPEAAKDKLKSGKDAAVVSQTMMARRRMGRWVTICYWPFPC